MKALCSISRTGKKSMCFFHKKLCAARGGWILRYRQTVLCPFCLSGHRESGPSLVPQCYSMQLAVGTNPVSF